jgi:hypothetical protein
MEDFHILRLAEEVGIAAATIGLVVSDRTQGCGYSAEAKHEREVLPGLVAAEALSSRTWE